MNPNAVFDFLQDTIRQVAYATDSWFTFFALIALEHGFIFFDIRRIAILMNDFVAAFALDFLECIIIVAVDPADLAALLLHWFYSCEHVCYNYSR